MNSVNVRENERGRMVHVTEIWCRDICGDHTSSKLRTLEIAFTFSWIWLKCNNVVGIILHILSEFCVLTMNN